MYSHQFSGVCINLQFLRFYTGDKSLCVGRHHLERPRCTCVCDGKNCVPDSPGCDFIKIQLRNHLHSFGVKQWTIEALVSGSVYVEPHRRNAERHGGQIDITGELEELPILIRGLERQSVQDVSAFANEG